MMNKEQLTEQIINPKTKGGEYFKRFYENQTDLFWKFWELNQNDTTDTSTGSEFQTLGKQVEMHMFNLENMLTSRQMGGKSTEKTVTSFYTLVENYFPLYGKIE